jgi:hypothetical protein
MNLLRIEVSVYIFCSCPTRIFGSPDRKPRYRDANGYSLLLNAAHTENLRRCLISIREAVWKTYDSYHSTPHMLGLLKQIPFFLGKL